MTRTVLARLAARIRCDEALLLIVLASTLLRLAFVLALPGFHTGDDVEILAAAWRDAFDLDYQPFAIRNLLVPELLVAPCLQLGASLGASGTSTLLAIGMLPFVVLASVNVVLVWRLAQRWLGNLRTTRIATALYAFAWIPLAYGSMAYPRTLSVTCVLSGALLLSEPRATARHGVFAGALLAIAFAARYSEIIFLAPLAACAWWAEDARARAKRLTGLLLGFGAGALLAVGLYDWMTWGSPFASLLAFAKYTLVEQQASSRVVSQPPWWYLGRLWFWLTPALWPAIVLGSRVRETRRLWWFIAVPLLVLSAVHHKELRYLQAVLPFVMLLAAAGLVRMHSLGWRRTATTLFVLSLVTGALGVRVLAHKSAAAVAAVQAMTRDQTIRAVALSQAWAYGGGLYLGNRVVVHDLGVPPSPAELTAVARDVDRIALYASDADANSALRDALRAAGFVKEQRYTHGQSRAVLLFSR